MQRAETSPPEEGRDSRARVARLLAGDHAARVFKLGFVVAAAFVSGVARSHDLRFPTSRTFPRAPLVASLPAPLVPALEYLLGSLLVFSPAALALDVSPASYLYAAVASLALPVSFDRTRLQPWAHQYLLVPEVVPQLRAPLRNFSAPAQMPTSAPGVGMASMEIFVGCGRRPSFVP